MDYIMLCLQLLSTNGIALEQVIFIIVMHDFVATTLPKLEKLLDQMLKDGRDNSIPVAHQFN